MEPQGLWTHPKRKRNELKHLKVMCGFGYGFWCGGFLCVCVACLRTRKDEISRAYSGREYEYNVDVEFPVISQSYRSAR